MSNSIIDSPSSTENHPAISLQKTSKRPIWMILGAVVAISLGGGWLFLQHAPKSNSLEKETIPLSVKTLMVRKQAISGIETVTGTVEPVQIATITSRVIGQVTSLPVTEGERVKEGQVLAKIDVKNLQAEGEKATATIFQAQAGVTVAQAARNQASTAYNQAIALLNQAVARKEQAIAQLREAQAQLANAKLSQRRMEMLSSQGAVAQVQSDDANTKVAVLQAQIEQAKASIQQAQRGIESARASVEQAKASVEQAKAGVKQAISLVKQAQAGKQEANANLEYGLVIAPFDGVVTHKQTEVGAMAGPGQSLVTLEGTKQLRFSVEIPESLISRVRQGESVRVRLDAINQVLTGHLSQIIPSANPSSRSFTVKIALPTEEGVMSGMFGRLELPRSSRQGITIPINALIQRGQLTGVYVVDSHHQATLRWVKTGKVQDSRVEITSGLVEGDRIIISNLSQLDDGQLVIIRNS